MIIRSTAVRLAAFLVVFFTSFVYLIPKRYDEVPLFPNTAHATNVTATSSTFNASMITFWRDFSNALVDAKPLCQPLKVKDDYIFGKEDWFTPLKQDTKPLQRLKELSEQDETALLRAHYKMRRSAQRLAPKMPFAKGTTGITTTTTAEDIPILLVSLRMIRRTGCTLPMEVFLPTWSHYSHKACENALPSLNARCIILSNILTKSNVTRASSATTSTSKPHAILFSTFQNVLYLDPDAFPTYDPTILFTTPPYTTHSLVTWPDTSGLSVSQHYYHIASLPPSPPTSRRSTSSPHILLNKAIHAPSLLLMLYYSHFGPTHYYPLLAQSPHPESEKEIYIHAATALALPYYQVRSAPSTLGRYWNNTYRAIGLAHADPGMDFEYLPPHPSHMHPSPLYSASDLAHPNATLAAIQNYTLLTPPPPRPVFLHQFGLRLDPETILADNRSVAFEPDGTRHRMWGLGEDVIRVLGYDVEERVWGAVVEEGCWMEREEGEVCRGLREWAGEVVGWMGSIERPW